MAVKCPICLNAHNEGRCELGRRGSGSFDCAVCGGYALSGSLAAIFAASDAGLTPLKRAALSHRIRSANAGGEPEPLLTSDWFDRFMRDPSFPNPATQANNLICFIGDRVRQTGKLVDGLQPWFYAVVGAASPELAGSILHELVAAGVVKARLTAMMDAGDDVTEATLTLGGWERYESLSRRGRGVGAGGFLAAKFGDATLDSFIRDVLKPAVKDGIGRTLVDMRDVSKAGVIDNLMRAQIRDASFVIVDLTHDNYGAYWEAGYAEGLDKPVIYICEKAKFDALKTHFDTNHSTTVMWSLDDVEHFKQELIATLRNSLNLFPA